MKRFQLLIKLILIFSFQISLLSQVEINEEVKKKIKLQILSKTDTLALKNLNLQFKSDYTAGKLEAIDLLLRKGYPIKGRGFEFQGFLNGRPIYNGNHNRIAAQTTSTDDVWSLYNLDGTGIEIGLWDEGSVYVDHTSFSEGTYGQRHAYFIDSTGSTVKDHSTHVAGTIIADNDDYYSKGMANESILYSRDYNADLVEMTNAAAGLDPNLTTPLILSNHSYGKFVGWAWADLRGTGTDAWYWMAIDNQNEDPMFGDYNQFSYDNDLIAYDAPYYTIVRSSGNDRAVKDRNPTLNIGYGMEKIGSPAQAIILKMAIVMDSIVYHRMVLQKI